MKIGELARLTGTPVETIRFYEREGLLPAPARTEGNYRVHDSIHVERLGFIRHCRALDMTLDEIRVLLRFKDDGSPDSCSGVNDLLDRHIDHVDRRIQELQQLAGQLKGLRARCNEPRTPADCGILHQLSQPSPPPAPDQVAHSHVQGSHGQRSRPADRTHPAGIP
jgi:Cd(II)/Pb(II)-responsive transcriptional regulator